ncbi:MAG: peptidylprolyl isomerase [Polyangiaceae bacterium]|nr:peptidylprolyl isomerase [Polyangiaceae bacterium]
MISAKYPEINVPGTGNLYARFVTTLGTLVIELEEKRAPKTVKNFVGLATGTQPFADQKTEQIIEGKPYFDGTIFHRCIKNFMVQGGDPTGTGRGGPGYRWEDEFHPELRHTGPGILSMANAGPNTNGSQFFITERATPHLDGKHAVFGRVVAGIDLIAKMSAQPMGAGDRPTTAIVLQRVEILRSESIPAV